MEGTEEVIKGIILMSLTCMVHIKFLKYPGCYQ